MGFADPTQALRRDRRLALGPGALAALARGARGVRGDAARPDARGGRRAPDPTRALNRFSDIVERLPSGVNFYRLLEARPQLAAAGRADPHPCAGAGRPAGAAADAARRADRRQRASRRRRRPTTLAARLRRGDRAASRSTIALDRVRRHGQRAPLRARRPADRRAPRPDRRRRGLLRRRRGARSSPCRRRRRASSTQRHGTDRRAASC